MDTNKKSKPIRFETDIYNLIRKEAEKWDRTLSSQAGRLVRVAMYLEKYYPEKYQEIIDYLINKRTNS